MKKINITNDFYVLDGELNNHKIVKVNYLFKTREVKLYYAYPIVSNKSDKDYIEHAKHDFHKFLKSNKSYFYSVKYLLKEALHLK